ncbi:hypothetical protein CS542_09165 [Pedobacter sp. IW39]|nr:hypothetical protein CS542_09165 [Pedobacter sp. IW39]
MNFHHMLLDGWSSPVLLEKLLLVRHLRRVIHCRSLLKDNYEDYIRYTERRDQEEEKYTGAVT